MTTGTRAASGLGRTLLLRALGHSGPATAKTLAASTGLPYPSVHQALTWLHEAGLVTRGTCPESSRGRTFLWEITPAGRSRIEGRAPGLADDCFCAIIIEDRPMTAEDVGEWVQRENKSAPVPAARVRDALSWLGEEPHAVIARDPGQRRWRRTSLSRAVTALDEWDWAGLELCLQILRDRQPGQAGMSRAVAAGIFAWAGVTTVAGDGGADDRRTCWAAGDEEGHREISWEQDPASGKWTLAFRILRENRWEAVREVTVPDISSLAWQVREIAGSRNPDAEVTWKPGDYEEGSFWTPREIAGRCDPALAPFRDEFASGLS